MWRSPEVRRYGGVWVRPTACAFGRWLGCAPKSQPIALKFTKLQRNRVGVWAARGSRRRHAVGPRSGGVSPRLPKALPFPRGHPGRPPEGRPRSTPRRSVRQPDLCLARPSELPECLRGVGAKPRLRIAQARYGPGMTTTDPSDPPQEPHSDGAPERDSPEDFPGAIPEPSPADGGPGDR
jgi:hypothetical protein